MGDPQEGAYERIELELRRTWWLGHGCSGVGLYGDDGEMQCACGRDFKREPLAAIREHVRERELENLGTRMAERDRIRVEERSRIAAAMKKRAEELDDELDDLAANARETLRRKEATKENNPIPRAIADGMYRVMLHHAAECVAANDLRFEPKKRSPGIIRGRAVLDAKRSEREAFRKALLEERGLLLRHLAIDGVAWRMLDRLWERLEEEPG